MTEDDLKLARRSTRLSISIPVVISGLDAQGNKFSESVHTLIVNKHGGKIATARHIAIGTEILIENPHLGVAAKANVVWLGEKQPPGDLNQVGVQLLEPKDIWGIAFPPNDWGLEPEDLKPAVPVALPDSARPTSTVTHLPSPAAEEIAIQLLQELQGAADAHAREFQDRVKHLTQRLGIEFESVLRERAARAKAHEVGALENELNVLRENLASTRKEIGTLEAEVQELKRALQATTEDISPTPLQEARRQLITLTNSVVESMNRAAEAGLKDYRSLLQKENQQIAARQRPLAKEDLPPSPAPVTRS